MRRRMNRSTLAAAAALAALLSGCNLAPQHRTQEGEQRPGDEPHQQHSHQGHTGKNQRLIRGQPHDADDALRQLRGIRDEDRQARLKRAVSAGEQQQRDRGAVVVQQRRCRLLAVLEVELAGGHPGPASASTSARLPTARMRPPDGPRRRRSPSSVVRMAVGWWAKSS
mgnify:CR=1 FL=1